MLMLMASSLGLVLLEDEQEDWSALLYEGSSSTRELYLFLPVSVRTTICFPQTELPGSVIATSQARKVWNQKFLAGSAIAPSQSWQVEVGSAIPTSQC